MSPRKMAVKLVLAIAISFASASPAFCAQIVGVVKTDAGQPVQGIKINAIDAASGKLAANTLTGPDGGYAISGLAKGKYIFKLDPLATGFQPGDGVAYLGDDGLTVDWSVSPSAVALDDATAGTGDANASCTGPGTPLACCTSSGTGTCGGGVAGGGAGAAGAGTGAAAGGTLGGIGGSTLAIAGVTTAVVAGGVVGGVAAAGGFSGGSSSPAK